MTKISFGWICNTVARHGTEIKDLSIENDRTIEHIAGVFPNLWFDDHFHKDNAPTLESWTYLTYIAAKFPQFTVGPLVMAQSFRNPALIAKMTSTLQYLTGGRLILGIGAGWKEDEHLAYGYPFPSGKVRLEHLEDAVNIIRTMWTQSPATYEGKHLSIHQAENQPLPNPVPPLLIGGLGEKVTLKLVAKYADWMNFTFTDPDTYAHKMNVLRAHCQDVGRDFESIRKSVWAYVSITPDGEAPPADKEGRFLVYGTPQQVTETLRRYTDVGVTHFMLRFMDFPKFDGIDLFIEKVMPEFL